MKLTKYLLFLLFSHIVYSQECPPIDISLLSKELTIQQSQLQDSIDECPNLTDAIRLAEVFVKMEEPNVAVDVMLDALNDVVKTDVD